MVLNKTSTIWGWLPTTTTTTTSLDTCFFGLFFSDFLYFNVACHNGSFFF